MAGTDFIGRLIFALGADLTPVRRLASPALRAVGWLAIVVTIGAALATVVDVHGMIRRLTAAPDMWIASISSAITTVLATLAAFQLSLPDRKAAWALLPLPAAAVWIGANGIGCLRQSAISENLSGAAPGNNELSDLYPGHFDTFLNSPVCHAAACLFVATEPCHRHWRARLRVGRRYPSQLRPSLRCRSDRSRSPCLRGRCRSGRKQTHWGSHARESKSNPRFSVTNAAARSKKLSADITALVQGHSFGAIQNEGQKPNLICISLGTPSLGLILPSTTQQSQYPKPLNTRDSYQS